MIKICDLMADGPDEDEDAKDYSKKIREALEAMQSTYSKLRENPEIMEED